MLYSKQEISKYRLSSAGLVYAHHGIEVLESILKKHEFLGDSECMKKLFINIYEEFIEELDAIDNGIPMYAEGFPRYRIKTHLSARVHRLNPEWNSVVTDNVDNLFMKAVKLVGNEFVEKVVEVKKKHAIFTKHFLLLKYICH